MNVPVVPLGELCEMDRQGLRADDPAVAGLPYVGVEHVGSGTGVIDFDTDSRVGAQKSTTFRFDQRHVLYAKLRPYLNKVAVPDFEGRCSTELVPLLPRDGIDRSFLGYLLRRSRTVDFVMASVTGSRMPRTDMKTLLTMPVPFPPVDEQRRIVDILNRAAKITRLETQAQERLRELIPALFIKMFGDPVENPMGWEVTKLAELGSLNRGRSRHRPRNAPELYDGPHPFVQTGDVAKGKGVIRHASQSYSELGLQQSKMWPAGTLCITIAANIGKTGILAFDACFPDSVVGFAPTSDSATVEYIQCVIDTMQARIEESAPMAAQRNINLQILRGLRVPLPPVERQRQFANAVNCARAIDAKAQRARRAVTLLTGSLMHDLMDVAG